MPPPFFPRKWARTSQAVTRGNLAQIAYCARLSETIFLMIAEVQILQPLVSSCKTRHFLEITKKAKNKTG